MQKKHLWLGIVHLSQMKAPTVQEVMNGVQYIEELKAGLQTCKKKGDVQKVVRKIIKKYTQKIVTEQVFLTDSTNKSHLTNASIIIDVETKTAIKNRFSKEKEPQLIEMYLNRYQDKIEQFKKKFGVA